jgi:hypothetical protein
MDTPQQEVLHTPYQYGELQHEDEIRVLVLDSGTWSDEITCRLEHVRLSHCPRYEALSYAWESLLKPRRVKCEDKPIEITESLFSALRRLRREDKRKVIWVDAICINQHNHLDKNHQVALMGRIYAQSHKTLAWIKEESDEVMRRVSDYISRLNKYLSSEAEGDHNLDICTGPIRITNHVLREISSNWAVEFFEVLGPLFERPWFTRLWVLQEVVLSRHVEMVFGAWSVPLYDFMRPAAIINHMFSLGHFTDWTMSCNFSNLDAFVNMGLLKVVSQDGTKYSGIFTFFDRAACLIASDQRDKIYGLLGLVNTPGFTADYTLPADKVFQSFALWCFEWRKKLDVLSRAGISMSESTLASWAPNPDISTTYLHFCDNPRFNASGEISVLSGGGSSFSNLWSLSSENTLCLMGKVIDITEKISRLLDKSEKLGDRGTVFEMAKMANCDMTTLSDRNFQRFCLAMICEQIMGADRMPHEELKMRGLYQYFQGFLTNSKLNGDAESIDHAYQLVWLVRTSYLQQCQFCITRDDRLSWVPKITEIGDRICVIRGANVPYVLRPKENGKFALVGECWVQGLMEGEALNLSGFQWGEIHLV